MIKAYTVLGWMWHTRYTAIWYQVFVIWGIAYPKVLVHLADAGDYADAGDDADDAGAGDDADAAGDTDAAD